MIRPRRWWVSANHDRFSGKALKSFEQGDDVIHLHMTRLFCGRCIGGKQQWKWEKNCEGIKTD